MVNGNIVEFVRAHPNHNRLRLVSGGSGSILPSYQLFGQLAGVATGLEYLHEHDIIHGDLKGVSL
jgi:serine/threonine protein kinase